jgi:hypothetical protein
MNSLIEQEDINKTELKQIKKLIKETFVLKVGEAGDL